MLGHEALSCPHTGHFFHSVFKQQQTTGGWKDHMMTLGYMLLNNKNEFVKISFSSTGKMLKKKLMFSQL